MSGNFGAVDEDGDFEWDRNPSVVDGEREILGIVTLENVIERILLMDIHDEKDRELAHKNLKERQATVMYHKPSTTTDVTPDDTHRRNTSYFWINEADSMGKEPTDFKSKFIREYCNVLLDDIHRTISIGDPSMFSPQKFAEIAPDASVSRNGSSNSNMRLIIDGSEQDMSRVEETNNVG